MEKSYTISFKAPFRVGGGHGCAGLYDHTPLFDGKGRIYLPGSAIKGKLRHQSARISAGLALENVTAPLNFRELCIARSSKNYCRENFCAYCRLFGNPRQQGQFKFHDAVLEGTYADLVGKKDSVRSRGIQTEHRTRTSLARSRKVVRYAHLVFEENGAEYLRFSWRITGPDDAECETLLNYACRALTHLGAEGAVGLGRLDLFQEGLS